MPQPSSIVCAISLRSVAMRSVPPVFVFSARTRCSTACACLSRLAELPGATDLAKRAASVAGDLAEDEQFGQRIGTEPVGAVDADAGAFTGGVEARQRRRAAAVDEDAAHRVMHRRAHRDRRCAGSTPRTVRPVRRSAAAARAAWLFAEVAQVEVTTEPCCPSIVRPFCCSYQNAWLRRSRGPEFHRLVARLVGSAGPRP
jgi:hypothetical protein